VLTATGRIVKTADAGYRLVGDRGFDDNPDELAQCR
jgi:hypothetical protein